MDALPSRNIHRPLRHCAAKKYEWREKRGKGSRVLTGTADQPRPKKHFLSLYRIQRDGTNKAATGRKERGRISNQEQTKVVKHAYVSI